MNDGKSRTSWLRNVAVRSVVFVIVCGFCCLQSALVQAEPMPVKVGIIIPLSGPLAVMGVALQRAVTMADEEFDTERKVEFVFEDDQYQPKNTVTAIQKLINVDHIRGLVVFGSASSHAVADLAERQKIAMVSISTATTVSNIRNYVVRHWVNADDEAKLLIDEGKRRGLQSVAVVTTQSDGFLAVRDDYIRIAPFKVLADDEVDPADRDFRAEALKIIRLKPSAVFLLLAPPQAGILARQLRQLNYKGELFSIHSLELEEEIHSPNSALLGAWYVLGDERPAVAFHEKYRERFGADAVAGAVNGYDIAKLFIDGLRTGDLNRYLHEAKDFRGAFGTYGANGHGGFTLPVTLKEVTANGLQYLKR